MAQAAYCSQCGTNVFVGPDGRCPNGHGPEFLSNFYEVADETPLDADQTTPAEWATAAAAEPPAAYVPPTPDYTAPTSSYSVPEPAYGGTPTAAPPKKSKTGLIIGIVAVLLLCCILTAVGGYFGFKSLADQAGEITDTVTDTTTDEDISGEEVTKDDVTPDEDPAEDEDTTGDTDTDALVEEMQPEVEGLIAQFYPDFTMNDFAVAGDPEEDSYPVHVIAESDVVEGFFITFFATRHTAEAEGDLDTTYIDEASGNMWTHPEGTDHGLLTMFGADAGAGAGTQEAIMRAFMDSHPDGTMNITDAKINSGSQVTLKGIPDEDLESWYDDFDSFESVIVKEGNAWTESSFDEY